MNGGHREVPHHLLYDPHLYLYIDMTHVFYDLDMIIFMMIERKLYISCEWNMLGFKRCEWKKRVVIFMMSCDFYD